MIWQEESEGHTMQQLAMHTLGLILAANTNVGASASTAFICPFRISTNVITRFFCKTPKLMPLAGLLLSLPTNIPSSALEPFACDALSSCAHHTQPNNIGPRQRQNSRNLCGTCQKRPRTSPQTS